MEAKWKQFFQEENQKEYIHKLQVFLTEEYQNHTVFPARADIFKAFMLTPLEKVKVVILGQDPYLNDHQAMGLAFSVFSGTPLPPSLKNIFQELENDLNIKMSGNGDLTPWATQGVLLLNTVLTVRKGMANSHRNHGWEPFTESVIRWLNCKEEPVVFLLWGKPAQEQAKWITNPRHLILTAPHPSPLSAYLGFFGCKHFSKTNAYLLQHYPTAIHWQL